MVLTMIVTPTSMIMILMWIWRILVPYFIWIQMEITMEVLQVVQNTVVLKVILLITMKTVMMQTIKSRQRARNL